MFAPCACVRVVCGVWWGGQYNQSVVTSFVVKLVIVVCGPQLIKTPSPKVGCPSNENLAQWEKCDSVQIVALSFVSMVNSHLPR